jgi:hypothetical protein
MGDALGELHYLLWQDLAWLFFEWHEYRALYGTDPSRIDLMNSTARRFFWSLNRVLWQDILLGLSRLGDPTGTGGQQNVTFRRLVSLVRVDLKDSLNASLDVFEAASRFARDGRDKRYAHRSYQHAAAPEVHPLALGSRAQVEEALRAAAATMNVVELAYQNSTTHYDLPGGADGGADSLLYYLDSGHEADTVREATHQHWHPRFK